MLYFNIANQRNHCLHLRVSNREVRIKVRIPTSNNGFCFTIKTAVGHQDVAVWIETAHAFDGHHRIQSLFHVLHGPDEIGGPRRCGIGRGGVLREHGSQIAQAQAERVAHFHQGGAAGQGGVGWLKRKGKPADPSGTAGEKSD